MTSGRVAVAVALLAAVACGHPAPAGPSIAPPKAPGYVGHTCGGVPFWVSSGNAKGKCHAQVDDTGGRLVAMACDDSSGNEAKLTCSKAGEVACTSAGTGICTTDEDIVQPAAAPPAGALANRCGGIAYFVIGEHCRASRDKIAGSISMHCDDGAGDSADYACRDGVAACSATGTGVCHP